VERGAPAPAADPARATDRILLPLLLADSGARERLMEGLREVTALRRLPTAPIYETLIAMHDAREPIGFNALHERLEDADQQLLSAIVLDAASSGNTVEDGLACIEALRRDERETIRRDLKGRIKIAEREGRMAEALDMMRQLAELR
jgi:hypothetical protein